MSNLYFDQSLRVRVQIRCNESSRDVAIIDTTSSSDGAIHGSNRRCWWSSSCKARTSDRASKQLIWRCIHMSSSINEQNKTLSVHRELFSFAFSSFNSTRFVGRPPSIYAMDRIHSNRWESNTCCPIQRWTKKWTNVGWPTISLNKASHTKRRKCSVHQKQVAVDMLVTHGSLSVCCMLE
jgi:hypothetical protein